MLSAGKIRLILAVVIVSAIAGIVFVAMKRLQSQGHSSPAAIVVETGQAEAVLRGIRVNETSGGNAKWNLVAEHAEYDTDQAVVKLADVRLTVAPVDKSRGELQLTSPTAIYNTETKDVSLSGGVTAKNSKGMEFTTRSVSFSGNRGVISTVDPVRFSDEELALEGTGMEYNVASAALKITRDVTATMRGGKRR